MNQRDIEKGEDGSARVHSREKTERGCHGHGNSTQTCRLTDVFRAKSSSCSPPCRQISHLLCLFVLCVSFQSTVVFSCLPFCSLSSLSSNISLPLSLFPSIRVGTHCFQIEESHTYTDAARTHRPTCRPARSLWCVE